MLEDQPTEKLRQDVADLLVSRIVNLPAEERVLKQAGPTSALRTGRPGRGICRHRKTVVLRDAWPSAINPAGSSMPSATGSQASFQVRPDL